MGLGTAFCYVVAWISRFIVEIDAKVIVDVIKNSAYVNQIISPILDDCRQLMTRFQ